MPVVSAASPFALSLPPHLVPRDRVLDEEVAPRADAGGDEVVAAALVAVGGPEERERKKRRGR